MSKAVMRTFVRKLGDVEVIVRMPIDMPDPLIHLNVHVAYTTERQRSAALEAFHMDEQHIRESDEYVWFQRETGEDWKEGVMTATVFTESPSMKQAA